MLATEIDTQKDVVERLAKDHDIEPSVWIGKKNLLPFVRQSFPRCAILDKDELAHDVGGPVGNVTSECLDQLESFWASNDFRSQRVNLLEEFNRYPTLGNLRTLDREVLLRKIQMRIIVAINEKSPDFLLAFDTPHNPVNLSAFYLAKWLEIPRLFFSGPGTVVPALIPLFEIGDFRSARELVAEASSSLELEAQQFNLHLANQTLESLSRRKETHWQGFEKNRLGQHRKVRFQKLKDIKVKSRREFERFRNRDPATLSDFLDRNFEKLIEAHAKLPVMSASVGSGLFLLQVQPEASVVPAGFSDTFQADAIIKARQILPQGKTLLVKEHPGQVDLSMVGSLGRSPLLYDFINLLPNTSTISAFSDTDKLLDSAQVVFTLAGSIGVEAAIRGIPVVYFGKAWWAEMPGTFNAYDNGLAEKLSNYARPPFDEIRMFLLDVIRSSSIPGFADSWSREYWTKQLEFPDGFQTAFINRMARTVASFADNLADR